MNEWIKEVLKFPSDDNVDIKLEISDDNCTNKNASQFSVIDVMTPFVNRIPSSERIQMVLSKSMFI